MSGAQKTQKRKDRRKEKYSLTDTLFYVYKTVRGVDKFFAVNFLACSISFAFYTLLGIYFPKVIIDRIEKKADVGSFVMTAMIYCVVMSIVNVIHGVTANGLEPRMTKISLHLENMILKKTIRTDYRNLENPEFLNYGNRASVVRYSWGSFLGMLRRSNLMLTQLILAVSAAVAVLILNPPIVAVLFVLAYLSHKILDDTMKVDKEKHNNAMQITYRQLNYMDGISKNLDYAKDIRLFGMFDWFCFIYEDLNKKFIKNHTEHHNRWIFCDMRMNLLALMQMVILYVWLIYRVLTKNMGIGDFTLYIGLVNTFTSNVTALFFTMSFLLRNKLEIDDYREYLDWPETVRKGNRELFDLEKTEFEFRHVSFQYPGHDTCALKDVNLTIKPGMKMAVVGMNGAGKTTFTKLLMGLYEPTEGVILLNGTDIREYDREKYFEIFSPVFQSIETFALPIWQNISLNTKENTDREKVISALEESGINTKVNMFSRGIDTEVRKLFHEDGIDFSGGEKQRMAMARALYKGGRVVVMDEPTAALDALAEDRMYREFDNMVQGKTSLFISHRLSSTRFCDEIILFENGEIVEKGTHDELMNRKGKYAEMYGLQSQYYREDGGNE